MSVYRMICRGKIFNQVCENVVHFFREGPDELDFVIAKTRDDWLPTLRNIQNANFNWFQVAGQKVSEPKSDLRIVNFPNQPGSLSGPGAHPSLAILMSLRAACAGRRCRGRIYVPGVHGESVSEGQVQVGAFVAFSNVAGLIMTRFHHNGSDFRGIELVIAPRSDPTQFKVVTQVIPRQQFGIQRRRNIGVGS
jgi:hypothetical protein